MRNIVIDKCIKMLKKIKEYPGEYEEDIDFVVDMFKNERRRNTASGCRSGRLGKRLSGEHMRLLQEGRIRWMKARGWNVNEK